LYKEKTRLLKEAYISSYGCVNDPNIDTIWLDINKFLDELNKKEEAKQPFIYYTRKLRLKHFQKKYGYHITLDDIPKGKGY
jgi:hypothetical protein